jgi:hypothetical protein
MEKRTAIEKTEIDFSAYMKTEPMDEARRLLKRKGMESKQKACDIIGEALTGNPMSYRTYMRHKKTGKAVQSITRVIFVKKANKADFSKLVSTYFFEEKVMPKVTKLNEIDSVCEEKLGETKKAYVEINEEVKKLFAKEMSEAIKKDKGETITKKSKLSRKAFRNEQGEYITPLYEVVTKPQSITSKESIIEKYDAMEKDRKREAKKENKAIEHIKVEVKRNVDIERITKTVTNYIYSLYYQMRDDIGSRFSTKSFSHMARFSPQDIISATLEQAWLEYMEKGELPSIQWLMLTAKNMFMREYTVNRKFSPLEIQAFDVDSLEQGDMWSEEREVESSELISDYGINERAIIFSALQCMPWNR